MTTAVVSAGVVTAGVTALTISATPAQAQVGSTTDIIQGQVTDSTGKPIANARVTARSVETGIARSRTTGLDGRYSILFPDGGGQYTLSVTAIGHPPRTLNIQKQADEDRILANVKLGGIVRAAQALQAVRVQGTRQNNNAGANQPAPGESQRGFSTEQASRLPVEQNDLNALAAITPGVVAAAGSDSTAAGFNVAGQRTTGNNLTLDGITFGSAQLPQEAVRGTRVITNTYDIARGQFSGGQIASTTRGGTNALQGSMSMQYRNPALQWRPDVQGPFGQGATSTTLSAGLGGPIIEDQMFWFGSVLVSQSTRPLATVTNAIQDPATLDRLGMNSDSVTRFLSGLNGYGIPSTLGSIPGLTSNNNVTFIGRFDWNINDEHTLTIRPNYTRLSANGNGIGTFSVPIHGGNSGNSNGGVQVTLTSRFSSFVNEAKAFYSTGDRTQDPYVTFPEGRVRVQSALDDGSIGVNTLTFGANPRLPQNGSNRGVEATNELSWIPGDGAHRVKFGALVNAQAFDQEVSFNRFGSYTYNTLNDFILNQPISYQRSLRPQSGQGATLNAAVYVGDTWRVNRNLQLTFGARLEGSQYTDAPRYNRAVDSLFGLKTDRFPNEIAVLPRVGFSYFTANENGPPTWFFRGGVGGFRGLTPSLLFSSAQQFSGVGGADSVLFCLGSAVPIVNWGRVVSGLDAIPSSCNGAAPPVLQQNQPQVVAFRDDFRSQQSWRASFGVTRRFWERWSASVDAQYALGTQLYGVQDANLNPTAQFTLASEGGRPVFVPSGLISTTTGVMPLTPSRLAPALGSVYAISSGLESRTSQVTAGINAFTNRGIVLNLSYTWQRVFDQSSFDQGPPVIGFAGPTTDANPNVQPLTRSSNERRHNFIGTITYPLSASWEITTIAGLQSGSPFTPIVGGDINGDGARNDRAFFFDPNSSATDPALAAGMRNVLANASPSARQCIEAQLGKVAARNSCVNPWFPTLNFQVNWKPDMLGLKRRLAVSFVVQNPLAGLDQAVNGSNNLKGWGQPQRSDNTLLYVRGFDATNRRFLYEVNERFGNAAAFSRAFFQPFQVGINARFSYGTNSINERFGGFGGGGGGAGGRGGQGGGGGGFGGLFGGGGGGAAARQASPIGRMIELRDSLGLDSIQVQKLQVINDSLVARNDTLGKEIRAKVTKLGNNPDPSLVFSTIRPDIDRVRALFTATLKEAEAVMTKEQWAKVPPNLKNPFGGFGGGGGGGGGGGRPPF